MNLQLVRILIEGTAKVLPKLAEKLGTTTVLIKDITVQEMADIFRSNPNKPKCATTTTPLSREQVLANCQVMFDGIKATISTSAMTKDGWHVVLADTQRPTWGGIGLDSYASQYLIATSSNTNGMTTVLIGYRLAEEGKLDIFGLVKKGSLERVNRVANLIQPNSGLQYFPE